MGSRVEDRLQAILSEHDLGQSGHGSIDVVMVDDKQDRI